MSRRLQALLCAGAVVLGLGAEWLAFGLDDLGRALPDVATGWTLIACGVVAWSRRPQSLTGPLLAGAGAAWFAGTVAGVAVYWHRGPLVQALLCYPSGRATSRLARAAVVVGYGAAVVTPVWDSEALTLVLAAALGLVAAFGYRRSVGLDRRARGVSLAAVEGFALVLAAGAAARLAFPGGDADEPALLVYELSLCATAVALSSALVSRAWERTPLTDLVVELGEARSGTLRDALAGALGDPTLEIAYWAPEAGGYVDGGGRALRLPERPSARAVTPIERDGQPLAALVHDPAVLDDPHLVESIAAAARLAAANARLQAALRAQVFELESSRRRLLAAGDEERRRLERRLRAGAERRLAALAESLEQARVRSSAGASARLMRAEQVLARARDDLRELARGLDPASDGLPRALRELARASPVAVELAVCEEPLETEVGTAVYFVCAEALANVTKYARATRVAIDVRREGRRVVVEIADDGAGGADPTRGTGLRGLSDRIAALGGRLRLDSPPGGGTRVAAEIPLDGEAR